MLPSGVYFESFDQEAGYLRTWPQRLWFVGFLLLLLVMPLMLGDYILGVLAVLGVTIIAVLGLQITVGMAGQINLGQSAFVGVGAFIAASLAANSPLPFWLIIPIGGLIAGLSSILFALPALRVKGFYLALTTVAAQIIFPIVVIRLPNSWFGGSAGMSVGAPEIFGLTLDSPAELYYVAIVVVLLAGAFAFNLQRSRVGRAFQAIRDNDTAAGVMGINLFKYKIMAFFAGAFLAGVAGALYAYYVRYVTAEEFTLWMSVWYIGMLIVGGLGSPLGAILGAISLTILQEVTHGMGGVLMELLPNTSGGVVFASTNIILGAAIVLMLIFEPHGLMHRWNMIKAAYRIWPYSHN